MKFLNSNINGNINLSAEEKTFWTGLIDDTNDAIEQLSDGRIYLMLEMVPEIYLGYTSTDGQQTDLEAYIYLLVVLGVFPLKLVGKNASNQDLYKVERKYQCDRENMMQLIPNRLLI